VTIVVNQSTLQEGCLLHWYKIIAVLGQGGFGVTYLAQDQNLDCEVAIKEYMPREFAVREQDENTIRPLSEEYEDVYRWGLSRFMNEAKTLARFKNPNIVRVYSVFSHNNTAYIVMEYELGEDLGYYFKRGELKRENELMRILLPLLDGLQLVHSAGFIHRDIKPSNIYVNNDFSPVLIDFGSARQALGGKTGALTTLVTHGYAPFEQYHESEKDQGPWSDIYALGATAYLAIAGNKPVDAMLRGKALLANAADPYKPALEFGQKGYSKRFLQAIDRALMFKESDRPQSALQWKQMFLSESAENTTIDLSNRNRQTKRHSAQLVTEKAFIRATPQDRGGDETRFTDVKKRSPLRAVLFALLWVVPVLIIAGLYFKPQLIDSFNRAQVGSSKSDVQVTQQPRITEKEKRVAEWLMQAEQGFATDHWAETLERYREVLNLDPENRRAQQGIERLARHYMDLASNAMQQGKIRQAEDYLSVVDVVRPDTVDLRVLKNKLAEQINLLEARRKEQEKQARRQAEKIQAEVTKQKSSIKGYQAQLSKAQENADAVEARIRAAGMYSDALHRKSQAIELISRANELQDKSRNDEALAVMKQAQTVLKQSINNFKAAHKEVNLQRNKEVLAQQQRIQVENSQEAIWAAQDRLAKTRIEADAISALSYAPEPYQQAQQQSRQAEGLLTRAAKLKEKAAYQGALEELDQAMSLFDQANRDLEKARDQAREMIEEQSKPKPLNRDDLITVKDLFHGLKQAYEQKDLNKILEIARLPAEKLILLEQIFEEYRTIEVSISDFSMISSKNIASATLTLEKLINNYGEHVAAGDSWRKTKITIYKEGEDWGKISW